MIRELFKNDEQNEITEAIRTIRSNIDFINPSEGSRAVVITSSIPGEGKSFLAENYAMSEAITGKRVIILDCDLRKPGVTKKFEISEKKNILELLQGRKTVTEVTIKNIEKNLDLIPAKAYNHNITELFTGNKIKEIIVELKKSYDLIIIDTPPLAVALDAGIIGKNCDGMVFVVGYNKVSRTDLSHSKKILINSKVNLYGIVVNKVQKSAYSLRNESAYYNSYHHYEEYYKKGESE